MKILAIRGTNLASLPKFEVNFCEGVLAATNIFAIVGPTGAGKSTLLDALCLALYACTPRLTGQSKVQIGYHDDERDRFAVGFVRDPFRQVGRDKSVEAVRHARESEAFDRLQAGDGAMEIGESGFGFHEGPETRATQKRGPPCDATCSPGAIARGAARQGRHEDATSPSPLP